MTTQDIIENLHQAQRDAVENRVIEEIPQSELDKISGARGDWFARAGFGRAF